MRRVFPVVVILIAFSSLAARAHDLQHEVGGGAGAVAVRLFFSDENSFSFEAYEIYRDGEDVPFQVGRTDALGRLVFIPDRGGPWRVKVFSEDGHGLDFSLTAGDGGTIEETGRSLLKGYSRLIVGVSVIFGLFGLLSLFVLRRN